MGEVTNAKNIKADKPKILRPTHFSCMKDIKAKKLVVGVIPKIFFFAIGVVGLTICSQILWRIRPKTLRPTK
jgi:hypothetical protein